jgi:hypothetical protein
MVRYGEPTRSRPVNNCTFNQAVTHHGQPFQIITDAFAPDYQINLSIQGWTAASC